MICVASSVSRRDRLGSYLVAAGGNVAEAVELYDWNVSVGAAFHEDIGRLEVILRNALDEALTSYGTGQGWSAIWYCRNQLFPGNHSQRAIEDITTARRRATRGGRPETHGKVIAELTFGSGATCAPRRTSRRCGCRR